MTISTDRRAWLGLAVLALPAPGASLHASSGSADTLVGADATSRTLSGRAAAALLDTARHASATGLHAVALVAAAVLVGMAVLIAINLGRLRTLGRMSTSDSGEVDAARPTELVPSDGTL